MLLTRGGMNRLRYLVFLSAALAACTTDPRPDDPGYAEAGGKADGAWCHINFWSVEGTNIRVDYQIATSLVDQSYDQNAQPTWLNVQRDDLDSANAVHVWIGDQTYWEPEGYEAALQWNELQTGPDTSIDLYRSPDDTRFTGQLSAGLAISHIIEGDDKPTWHAHQFAIEIDGNWQTDPVSGTHNFLATRLDECAQ